MKYSNGFYLFKYTNNEGTQSTSKNEHLTEIWIKGKSVGNFSQFDYIWLKKDKYNAISQINDTTIWIDEVRQLLIIFLQNEYLVMEVLEAVERKYSIECKSVKLSNSSILFSNGISIIPKKGINNLINKVKTSLLKSDIERKEAIEKVLVGDRFG